LAKYYVWAAILYSTTRIHFITSPALVQGRAEYHNLNHRVEKGLFGMLLRGKCLQHRLLLHPCEHTAHSYDDTIMVEPCGTQLSSNSDLERESRIKRTACSSPLLQYFYRVHYPLFAIMPSHSTSAKTHNSYHYRVVIRRKESGLMESSESLPGSYSNFVDPVTPKPVF